VAVRFFASQDSHAANHSTDVVIPELVPTLEWVLSCPPNVHQFDEPPVSLHLFFLNIVFSSFYCWFLTVAPFRSSSRLST
jgi:hypothetical protein